MVEDNNIEEKVLTPEEREEETKGKQKAAVDRIIRGVNDTFIKHYNFEDMDVQFTIKIQAPNALEIGRIHARMASYLGGMNNYMSEYMITVYNTLATIRVNGKDVPKELEDDEKIYNLDILYEIGRDFQQWLNKFQL